MLLSPILIFKKNVNALINNVSDPNNNYFESKLKSFKHLQPLSKILIFSNRKKRKLS